MGESLLQVENTWKRFGRFAALAGVTLSVQAGEVRGLIGPNGAGKTTLFNVITGQLSSDTGTIRFRGARIDGTAPHTIVRQGVARTFQVPAAFRSLTARENVQVALEARRGRHRALWGCPGGSADADALLESVGLGGAVDQRCANLSLSDVKRVELALALATEPALLLLDEPVAGMARSERTDLLALLGRIVRARGVTVLFIEHDMDVVFEFATRISVMHHGAIVADGHPDVIRVSPLVRQIYLGEEG